MSHVTTTEQVSGPIPVAAGTNQSPGKVGGRRSRIHSSRNQTTSHPITKTLPTTQPGRAQNTDI